MYKMLLFFLVLPLSLAAQENQYLPPYNPDLEPDGMIGVTDILSVLGIYGEPFMPDSCFCGCPAGNEYAGPVAGDTLSAYDVANAILLSDFTAVSVTLSIEPYGDGYFPFYGDTTIQYECFDVNRIFPRQCETWVEPAAVLFSQYSGEGPCYTYLYNYFPAFYSSLAPYGIFACGDNELVPIAISIPDIEATFFDAYYQINSSSSFVFDGTTYTCINFLSDSNPGYAFEGEWFHYFPAVALEIEMLTGE